MTDDSDRFLVVSEGHRDMTGVQTDLVIVDADPAALLLRVPADGDQGGHAVPLEAHLQHSQLLVVDVAVKVHRHPDLPEPANGCWCQWQISGPFQLHNHLLTHTIPQMT